jgi:hypothetical protein
VISADKISYKGWQNVWRLSNPAVMLLVTSDVGPRVLHLGLQGQENEFYEVPEQAGLTVGDEFRMYGGHRLWVAPETERTTFPDNLPVQVQTTNSGAVFAAPPESSGLQKTLELRLHHDSPNVEVVHTIRNTAAQPTVLSAWALSVLRPGGRAVLPLFPPAPWGPEHLQPVSALSLWSYTDLAASSWKLGPKYIQLDQSLAGAQGFGMQKLGFINKAGWGAYIRENHVFIKRIAWHEGTYVDTANFELFANKDFLELETLSPQQELQPGETYTHIENWSLHSGGLDDIADLSSR